MHLSELRHARRRDLSVGAEDAEREASPEPEVSSEERLAAAAATAEAAAAEEAERLAEQQLSKKVRVSLF